jgi:hypothetical protein
MHSKLNSNLSFNPFYIASLLLGGLINVASYGSLALLPVLATFFIATYSVLTFTSLGGTYERLMFLKVFSIGVMVSAIAAIYANQFQDPLQISKDAANFFNLATFSAEGLSLFEVERLSEGSLAIVIWRAIYDFFAIIGFEKMRYVGIFANLIAVCLSGVLGIKIVRRIFGNDEARFHRLTILFSFCGMFWLFAGIHNRDCWVLLAVTFLTYVWVRFITKPGFGLELLQLLFWNLLSVYYFQFLRSEFAFVPFAMTLAAVSALFMSYGRKVNYLYYILNILVIFVTAALIIYSLESIMTILRSGMEGYSSSSVSNSGANSLGVKLIIDQPIPIRLVFGSLYLFVFPIPFWSGFSFESAYFLFKSVNAIFFYFVIPMLCMGFIELVKYKSSRTPANLFITFLSLGFIIAVAGTSLETRHIGVFFTPILILAMIPDFSLRKNKNSYQIYLSIILFGVLCVHTLWVFIKLF